MTATRSGHARPRAEVALNRDAVWLDAQGVQSTGSAERGIARYIVEQTRALLSAAPDAVGAVRLDPALPVPPSMGWLNGSGKLELPIGNRPPSKGAPSIWHVMSPFELVIDVDRMWPYWARENGVRTVVTLYDLIPFVFSDRYLDRIPSFKATYMARVGLIRSAHQVLTISEFTARDAIERLGIPEERLTVVDSGVSSKLSSFVRSPAEAKSILAARFPRLRDGFLLYVGGDDWRKNMEGTIQAYALLPESLRRDHQLAIVCRLSAERVAELMGHARELGIADGDLLLTGYVEDRELAALYRGCELFVFPSLYEGAGLPILEAMSCGAPVAASRTTSIPEILGDLEATFDPADPEDIATCLGRVLDDPVEVERLRERSANRVEVFTWERVAERTLEGYERALSVPSGRWSRKRARKRLAVVTPWPPQASGVADHSRLLVEQLSAHLDIDVIVPDERQEFDRSLEPLVGVRSEADLGWLRALRGYDRQLYVLGGSRFHAHALEAIRSEPGIVLAHDVRLVGAYIGLHQRRFPYDVDWLEDRLVEMYGGRLSRAQLRRINGRHLWADYEIFMTGEVQAMAERILVHSDYQASILRLDRGDEPGPEAGVVPLGVRDAPAPSGGPVPDGDPLVVSYGIVSLPLKRVELTLRGFTVLAREHPSARLVFVGEVSDADRATIHTLAARLRIADRVELRGRVGDQAYWDILHAAHIAIQLRAGLNGGEASAAVADSIAAHVPTIVSDIGWFAELPEGVVVGVPEDTSAEALAGRMSDVLTSDGLRQEIEAAQADYAGANSFARVAKRYIELLDL
jgi:glycosyltransferase involved in cell wall biosynthesis